MRRVAAWMFAAVLAASAVAGLLLWSPEPDYSRLDVATAADLERELGALRDRLAIPGLSAAIADGDRIVWARGFGYADLDRRIPVDPDTTSFHLASVTKPYAATVVLQLADEGRVSLDAPVTGFGVDMPRVQVWHLLSHTSQQPPGAAYRYDPRAFGALTPVVERAGGRAFAAELTDRIVRRAGLAHTAPNPREVDGAACRAQLSSRLLRMCGAEGQPELARDTFLASGLDRASIDRTLAIGYAHEWGRQLWPAGLFGPMRPEQHLTSLFASAGLVASATDVLRFSIALDRGTLMTSSTLERMYTPALSQTGSPTFGLGWFLQQYEGQSLAWQFGQATESSSLLLKLPKQGVAFVVLANSDGLSRRRRLGDSGDVLKSPAATLFLKWYVNGKRL